LVNSSKSDFIGTEVAKLRSAGTALHIDIGVTVNRHPFIGEAESYVLSSKQQTWTTKEMKGKGGMGYGFT